MKKRYILVACLASALRAQAQDIPVSGFGEQQIISRSADIPVSIYAADLDQDGDLDVLSASGYDDKIAWYENQGNGSFGEQQIITTHAYRAYSVYATDLDQDGDLDVLSASGYDDKIAWYENDGNGSFGEQQIITTAATGAASVYAADLDQDGDMDVLSASGRDDKIAWYENDGNGSFGEQQIITTAADAAGTVYAADLDQDGDMDVLSASGNDYKIAWYENQGDGSFGEQQVITTDARRAVSVYAADLDNDGDIDVLSASNYDNEIAWYENDGNGSFGEQQVITAAATGAGSVYAADLDQDGDMDVLSASGGDRKVAWYENDGNGSFGEQMIITRETYGAYSVYAADLDQDGDLDVLSASQFDDKIAWYENLMGVEEFSIKSFVLVNAETDEELQEIKDGDTIDLATLSSHHLSIAAITEPERVGSVAFSLRGPFIHRHTENNAPYAIFGDNPRGDYAGRLLPPGEYTLTATPYEEKQKAGTPLEIHFTIIHSDAIIDAQVTAFDLYDAVTDKKLMDLTEGSVIDTDELAHEELTVLMHTVPNFVGSVKVELWGPLSLTRIENTKPYALFRNNSKNLFGQALPAGEYTLKATPYPEENAEGAAGMPLEISFTVVGEDNNNARLAAYPVPISGVVNISYQGSVEQADLMLLDYTGQPLLTLPLKEQTQLDMSTYRKGIYYLKVVDNEGVHLKRVVVE